MEKILVGAERNRRPLKQWRPRNENYRLVWGWSDRERYSIPERWLERWHLEWHSNRTHAWERIATFEEGITKEYIEPCSDWIDDLLNQHRRTLARTSAEIRAAIEAELAEKEAAGEKRKIETQKELEAPFALKQWMPTSGPLTPESRRRATWEGAN